MGKGSGTSSRLSVKMWSSGTSLSRFELENAGLRTERDLIRFERENANLRNGRYNPRRCRTLCVRAEPAVGGDERVQIKEILFLNDGLRNGKIRQKM